jgi:hypothetical protein
MDSGTFSNVNNSIPKPRKDHGLWRKEDTRTYLKEEIMEKSVLNEIMEKMSSIATNDLVAFSSKIAGFNREDVTAQAIERERWWEFLFPTHNIQNDSKERELDLLMVYLLSNMELDRRSSEALITKTTEALITKIKWLGEISKTKMKNEMALTVKCRKKMSEMDTYYERIVVDHAQRRARQMLFLEKFRNETSIYNVSKEMVDQSTEVFFSRTQKVLDEFIERLTSVMSG